MVTPHIGLYPKIPQKKLEQAMCFPNRLTLTISAAMPAESVTASFELGQI